jgi:hypothetical protein
MEILNLRREGIMHEYNIDIPTLNINVKPRSKPEINLTIRQMKNWKAGGSDGISEILKADITLSTDTFSFVPRCLGEKEVSFGLERRYYCQGAKER